MIFRLLAPRKYSEVSEIGSEALDCLDLLAPYTYEYFCGLNTELSGCLLFNIASSRYGYKDFQVDSWLPICS
jgi:hypothetical protein